MREEKYIQEEDEPNAADNSGTASDGDDIESLKKKLEEQEARAEANMAGWQRAQADFTNYKRRSEQEKSESGNYARAELATAILPALDNLELAMEHVPQSFEGDTWVDGVKLVARNLLSSLEAQGLSIIEALGKPFDPNIHEAAAYSPGEEGVVIQELKRGYKFNERVIRPSSVVVGNGKSDNESKKED